MFVNITEMTRCEQHESLQNSQPLGKNAKLVLRIFDRKNLNLGTQLSPAGKCRVSIFGKIDRCAQSSKVHEERRKPAYLFYNHIFADRYRRRLILRNSFSFSEQSTVVETKAHFTIMTWRFSVSRATTVALALFLCLGLIQFSMAQNEVEVSIGRTISANNNDLYS